MTRQLRTRPFSVVHTAAELRDRERVQGRRALVMTMGALHEGHAGLVRTARELVGERGQVVVTVFVNPLQFGAGEDLDRYPRTLESDTVVAERAGADLVFAPSAEEVYPGGDPQVRIGAGPMGERLEGATRPGHFDGMLTVVGKMFHLTRPDMALFGQKDAQQLALVRRMVQDLNFGIEIVAVPTVREDDGLALSSRNRYLTAADRATALVLSRALFAGREQAAAGARPDAVRAAARQILDPGATLDPPVDLDYLALVDPADFTEVPEGFRGEAVLALAAKVGTTRLIDNLPLDLGDRSGQTGGSSGRDHGGRGDQGGQGAKGSQSSQSGQSSRSSDSSPVGRDSGSRDSGSRRDSGSHDPGERPSAHPAPPPAYPAGASAPPARPATHPTDQPGGAV